MGLTRRDPEFVTDICLCEKVFKGPQGRFKFMQHSVECKTQLAYRGASN